MNKDNLNPTIETFKDTVLFGVVLFGMVGVALKSTVPGVIGSVRTGVSTKSRAGFRTGWDAAQEGHNHIGEGGDIRR